jgi:hypothetical protein
MGRENLEIDRRGRLNRSQDLQEVKQLLETIHRNSHRNHHLEENRSLEESLNLEEGRKTLEEEKRALEVEKRVSVVENLCREVEKEESLVVVNLEERGESDKTELIIKSDNDD